ncbi:hypothetical protein [Mesorhizobium sp.]|uniref:DUF2158 domain-containing protein n=1 Tax=Mesorhizobium sp. TaxID=1871066 RepID=UPI000FE772DD|nr:hypothetical protein [Mesorhizobium sp.]RWO08215.1 MAG: hypothetical protein EOS15_29820 [Mesorhizobium sp.]
MNATPFYNTIPFDLTPGAFADPTASVDFDGFVAGDIVNLITGSPDLVVLSACDECGSVEVAWFDGASLSVQFLPEEVLVHAD